MLRGVHNNVAMPVRFMASFHSIYAQNMQGYSRSYYEVLNVPLNSSGKEIKQAFFELSKKYHPDGNSGAHDSDEFVKVCEAYRILYKRASREHYANRLRSRYHKMAPVDICWTNKNVHKNWTKFQAAIRHKQCGHEITIISVPIVLYKSNHLERPKEELRLLPAGNLLPVIKKFDPGEVLRLPPPFTQSQESWLSSYYMAAFGMVLALLVLDSSKRAKYTSDLNDQIVSRQRSFKYFSGLLSVICQT